MDNTTNNNSTTNQATTNHEPTNQELRTMQVTEKKTSKFKWFTLGCLSSVVFLAFIWIIVILGITIVSASKAPVVKPNSFLHIRLSGNIDEYKQFDDSIFSFTTRYTGKEITDRIYQAADDDAIEGIFLEPRFVIAGFAVINEIIEAIEYFKSSGKVVYAYLELSSNQDYYLASAADKIFLHPSKSSGIILTGVGVSSLYLKDMMDKLGVEMTILHAGRFKGVGEEFSRRSMSREMRESINMLLDDYYDLIISDIALRRGLTQEDVKNVYEKRDNIFINGKYAIDSGLVDQLATRSDFIDFVKKDNSHIVTLGNYRYQPAKLRAKDRIAVVYMQGMIAMASDNPFDMTEYISSSSIVPMLKEIEEDNRIKAVVIRVNSPGGSALESETIYQAIARLRLNKPVVVSMGNVAASGGYYISAPADYIVADPYTMTGSIGVAAMIPNFHKMGQKIGANPQSLSRGKYANFLNVWETPKEEDIRSLQLNLNRIYDEFILRVADGRAMQISAVNEVAQGRIWTSRRAKDAGLIDDIGSLNYSIDKAATLKELVDFDVTIYPKQKTVLELLMEKRFNLSITSLLKTSGILPEEGLVRLKSFYDSIRKDPIQFLAPVTIIEQ